MLPRLMFGLCGMVSTSHRGFCGLLMHWSLSPCSITAGDATGQCGVEVQPLPKPHPRGISMLLIG